MRGKSNSSFVLSGFDEITKGGPDPMPKITLFAMTQKSHQLLVDTTPEHRALLHHVVIGKDSALDDDHSRAIEAFCIENQIPCSFRDGGAPYKVDTEYALAVSWRWMIDFPQDRLIVFHDSLLPRCRGFNPLVTALINGDSQVGVTALLGSDRYDAGPIVAQASMPVSYPIKIAEAINQIGRCYTDAAAQVFEQIASGAEIRGTPQDETAASYSLWRDADDYRLDWSRSNEELARTVDAVGSPYAGAETLINGTLAKVLNATALPDVLVENRVAGKVLWIDDGCPVVVCGSGLLRIDDIRDAGSGVTLLPLERFRSRFA